MWQVVFAYISIESRIVDSDVITFNSCSKLVISGTEHLVEVVDKLSSTTVVFFRSERIRNASTYMESKMLTEHARCMLGSVKGVKE